MNVLSLFDGMSCGQIAFERTGIKVDNYFASEIDKYAIEIAKKNYPNTKHIGSVTEVFAKDLPKIDIVIGGSPCQGFSFAGKQLNFEDPRSALFFEFVRLLRECKPKYFLLENVCMAKESENVISGILGEIYPECVKQFDLFGSGNLEPILINSALVSAQSRKRLYWTNIPNVSQPKDKGILLKDILESDAKEPVLSNIYGGFNETKPREHFEKSCTIRTAAGGGHIPSVTLKTDDDVCVIDDMYKNRSVRKYFKKSPTLRSDRSGLKVEEPVLAAQRGRYNNNGEIEQKMEIRKDGKTNTLTTVQKDNLIRIPEATAKGYVDAKVGDGVDLTFPTSKTRQGRLMQEKCNCLTAANYDYGVIESNYICRKLTPIECERLQTVPDNYTEGVSNSQRYKMLGNGWTVDVICHIFKYLKFSNKIVDF